MSTNITTLILNLLISESRMHRNRIAENIMDILDTNVGDFGKIESMMRSHFITRMMAFVENPLADSKNSLFEIADFYKEYYIETRMPEYLAAAA